MSHGLLLINIANQRMTKASGENSTNISKLFEIFLFLLNQNLVFFYNYIYGQAYTSIRNTNLESL